MIISNLYARINHLVPNPLCRTKGNEYNNVIWDDIRQKPTEAELQAVSDLVFIKIAQKEKLNAVIKTAIVSGISNSALGASHHYPTSVTDQQNLNGLITESLLPAPPLGYKFWCADSAGVWMRRAHDKEQIQQIGKSVVTHVKSQQASYEQALSDIDAAQTESEILSVVI